MTEVGLATLNPPSGDNKQGSIGPPIGGFRIELRDDDGTPIGAGIRRPDLHPITQPDGRLLERPGGDRRGGVDGWLDSGDLAHADEDGYLWFFGRKKQIIVHDGSNISPSRSRGRWSSTRRSGWPAWSASTTRCTVRTCRAYVTVRRRGERPSSADLIVYCRDRMGYKAPEEIVFLDEMPLNPTGKIDRVGLKRMAEDHLHPHLATPRSRSITPSSSRSSWVQLSPRSSVTSSTPPRSPPGVDWLVCKVSSA